MDDSADAYEQHANVFLKRRDASTIGREIVRQWGRTLPEDSTVIELACGSGYPITQALTESISQLWAIDSSPTLLRTFQSRFPHVPVQCSTVQTSDFFNRQFDAVIAVGLLFLLSESVQMSVITTVSSKLNPGGRFLFTAPTQTGTWRDLTTGIQCTSLGEQRYLEILSKANLKTVATYMDDGQNHYYEAMRVNESVL